MINEVFDLAIDASAGPVAFTVQGPFTLKKIDIDLECGEYPMMNKYGSLPYLTNGVKGGIYKLDDTPLHEFFKGMTCQCNMHLWWTKFDIQVIGTGFSGVRYVDYAIGNDEKLMFIVADDLSGLASHTIHILGDD